jgi:hypothetical protein
MKHLELKLEKLEQRIAPGKIGCSAPKSGKSGGSGGSKAKSGGSKGGKSGNCH